MYACAAIGGKYLEQSNYINPQDQHVCVLRLSSN